VGSYYALVGVTLQKELTAEEVPVGIRVEPCNLWRGETHREYGRTVRLLGERHGHCREMNPGSYTGPNLKNSYIKIRPLEREPHDWKSKEWVAVPWHYQGI